MSKIATYSLADTPLQLSDRLIGTEAPRPTPSATPLATKNFSLGELLQLFSSNFPAATLQAVLDAGNTATQNITLVGTIDTTLIRPDNIEDTSGSQGLPFQFLSKGASSINWGYLPVDNLQAVLNAGNTATQNITLIGNITSTRIIPGNIQDDTTGIGTTGQFLSKTASGIRWVNAPTTTTPGLGDVLSVNNTAINNINLTGNVTATSFIKTGGTNLQYLMADGSVTTGGGIPTLQEVLDNNHDLVDGNNFQGTNAGLGNTGTNVIGIGDGVAQANSGSNVVSIGSDANCAENTGNNLVALGIDTASSNSGSYVVAIGFGALNENVTDEAIAIGRECAQSNTGEFLIVMGSGTGQNNSGDNVNAFGNGAVGSNEGNNVNAIGNYAAASNTGSNVNALGNSTGYENIANNVNAMGSGAARSNSGDQVNAFGTDACFENLGGLVNAFGTEAGYQNTGNNSNFLGEQAGEFNTGEGVNAMGAAAGLNNTFNNVNLFGQSATADEDGQTVLSKDGTIMARISTTDLTATRKYTLQDGDGTLAFLSDIPSGGVTSVTATSPITSSGGTTPDISTSMATNKLIGRSTAGTGVMEEITIGTGLTLSGGTLNASATGGIPHATASGTDTYTATVTGVTAYNDGDAYLIRFTNGNTSSATLNINSLGAIPLYRNNDGVLIGGDIISGGEMLCVYNSTTNRFQVIGTAPNSLFAYVTNDDSVTLTKGMPVYAFGGTGDRMTVKRAYNTGDATSAQTVGLVLSTSIAANQKGLIMMQGLLDGLSILPKSTWADGDPVYLGATAGTITNVKPYAPNHLVYLGVVTTASNGAAGRMYVRVQNGYELQELHNVQAQSPSLNDTLWYDNTVSPAQWKTASIPTILGYTPTDLGLVQAMTQGLQNIF